MKLFTGLFFFLICALLSAQNFKVTPMPFRDSVTIELKVDYGDSVFLQIWTISGIVSEELLPLQKVTRSFSKAGKTGSLQDGIYILRSNHNRLTKVVKAGGMPGLNYQIHVNISENTIPDDSLFIFPNPISEGELHVLFSDKWESGTLMIISPEGKIVEKTEAQNVLNEKENRWKIANLPEGFYRILLEMNGKIISKTLWVRN